MPSKYTNETRDDILALAEGGVKVAAIADQLHVSATYVYRVLADAQFEYTGTSVANPGGLSNEDIEELLTAYRANVSTTDIKAQFNLSPGTLYYILRNAHEPMRSVTVKSMRAEQVDLAIEMYQDPSRLPIWKIVEETGVQQPVLHAQLHLRGIPLRNGRS